MNLKTLVPAILSSLFIAAGASASVSYGPSTVEPPWVPREFRAAWVATVGNIDWPSKPGLPVKEQKAEMVAILDRAANLHLNAILFQVRPVCDALYASPIEPWSYYLTGTMGKAPEPFYDPLAFAVAEAHQRGLELHAWFNPYRAGHPSTKLPFAPNHISQTHPNLVRHYGPFLWLDPGEREVQDYSFNVVMDVVKRYDIDGVAFDDYFYPYKEKDLQQKEIDFPDYQSWKRYGAGGRLTRDDWRRENINNFIRRVYTAIKAEKPWVKFGVSPFGIWQPGHPKQITGLNAYTKLYADARKWLMNGWMDYCSPQLYWAVGDPEHSFPILLRWWTAQNPKHRNIWPGLNSERVGVNRPGGIWKAEEIANQINLTRERCDGAAGEAQYSMRSLMQDMAAWPHCWKKALMPNVPWCLPRRGWKKHCPKNPACEWNPAER